MAKIGCLKPFRGTANALANVVLEDGEIAFDTTNKRIYIGNGSDIVSSLTPFINNGNVDISNIGDGSITGAISTINNNIPLTFTIGESDYGNDLVGYVKNGIGFINGSSKAQPPNVWCKIGTITNPSYWPKIQISCTTRDASGTYFGMAVVITSGEIRSYHTNNGYLYMHYDFVYPTV